MDRRDFLLGIPVILSGAIAGPDGGFTTTHRADPPPISNDERCALQTAGRYTFRRSISRKVLNDYLARAVTHYGLCASSPEPSTAYFEDDLRMLTHIGAKFVGRAAYAWVPPDDDEAHFRLASERAARIHAVDPEMVLQAAVFEAVYEQVGRIPVPGWVFSEFQVPVEKRAFRYDAMLYEGGKYKDHWTHGASIPDMSKLEARMYFYYRARRYIDAGSEAIHFGEAFLMDENDPSELYWSDLLTRVRRYAARSARRGMVLCDAHTHGVLIGADRLLFDSHAWPLMARDIRGAPERVVLVKNYYNAIYGYSAGGVTPSGWRCDSLPYLCEFDCGGNSGKPGQPSRFPWNWGYSGGDWFAHQPAAYQTAFLRYARQWLLALNEDAWLQMPTRLNLAWPVEGQKMWHANTRSNGCPVGFSLEEAIRTVWEGDGVRDAQLHAP